MLFRVALYGFWFFYFSFFFSNLLIPTINNVNRQFSRAFHWHYIRFQQGFANTFFLKPSCLFFGITFLQPF